ncbi:MAG: lipopolysaccharide kinase InaA family protein [Gammaproteobacteria bacterium]
MDAIFKLPGSIISKSKQSEIFIYNFKGKTFYIKRYFRSENVRSWLGFSRFRVEVRNQTWFNQQAIPSAKVVAIGEESFLLKTRKGVLITEGVENSKDLLSIVQNTPEKFEDTHWRDSVFFQIAKITSQLHEKRFCHNDLHWRNILVQDKKNSEPKIFLIDCPSGKRLTWPLLHYHQIKDLANLDKKAPRYLTRTQRLKYFLVYKGSLKLSLDDKKIVREIFKHKENRIRRKAKEQ